MTDPRFHAFVKLKSTDTFRILALDLSERDLKKFVVTPYKAGKPIYWDSTITRIEDIEKLKITQSQQPSTEELRRLAKEHQELIDRENRENGVVILTAGRGRSALELMGLKEVTPDYFSNAPGSGTTSTKIFAFFHNQWVIGVSLLLIGVVIGKIFA